MFRQRRMTKGIRALGLTFDVIAILFFLIAFMCTQGWQAVVSLGFAAWCAYDWWIGYNAKIVEEE